MTTRILADGERLAVSPRRAWNMLDIGNTRGYELLKAGELESYMEGRARRITVRSIQAYIDRQVAAASIGNPRRIEPPHRRRASSPEVAK